jgi:hypothetical protein
MHDRKIPVIPTPNIKELLDLLRDSKTNFTDKKTLRRVDTLLGKINNKNPLSWQELNPGQKASDVPSYIPLSRGNIFIDTALQQDHFLIIPVLIKAGANINLIASAPQSHTILMWQIDTLQPTCSLDDFQKTQRRILFLLEQKAGLSIINQEGETALSFAINRYAHLAIFYCQKADKREEAREKLLILADLIHVLMAQSPLFLMPCNGVPASFVEQDPFQLNLLKTSPFIKMMKAYLLIQQEPNFDGFLLTQLQAFRDKVLHEIQSRKEDSKRNVSNLQKLIVSYGLIPPYKPVLSFCMESPLMLPTYLDVEMPSFYFQKTNQPFEKIHFLLFLAQMDFFPPIFISRLGKIPHLEKIIDKEGRNLLMLATLKKNTTLSHYLLSLPQWRATLEQKDHQEHSFFSMTGATFPNQAALMAFLSPLLQAGNLSPADEMAILTGALTSKNVSLLTERIQTISLDWTIELPFQKFSEDEGVQHTFLSLSVVFFLWGEIRLQEVQVIVSKAIESYQQKSQKFTRTEYLALMNTFFRRAENKADPRELEHFRNYLLSRWSVILDHCNLEELRAQGQHPLLMVIGMEWKPIVQPTLKKIFPIPDPELEGEMYERIIYCEDVWILDLVLREQSLPMSPLEASPPSTWWETCMMNCFLFDNHVFFQYLILPCHRAVPQNAEQSVHGAAAHNPEVFSLMGTIITIEKKISPRFQLSFTHILLKFKAFLIITYLLLFEETHQILLPDFRQVLIEHQQAIQKWIARKKESMVLLGKEDGLEGIEKIENLFRYLDLINTVDVSSPVQTPSSVNLALSSSPAVLSPDFLLSSASLATSSLLSSPSFSVPDQLSEKADSPLPCPPVAPPKIKTRLQVPVASAANSFPSSLSESDHSFLKQFRMPNGESLSYQLGQNCFEKSSFGQPHYWVLPQTLFENSVFTQYKGLENKVRRIVSDNQIVPHISGAAGIVIDTPPKVITLKGKNFSCKYKIRPLGAGGQGDIRIRAISHSVMDEIGRQCTLFIFCYLTNHQDKKL